MSADRVSVDPTKVWAVIDWPIQKSVSEVLGFFGLTGYYLRFVCGYATIAGLLTDLRWICVEYSRVQLICSIENRFDRNSCIRLPNFELPFTVETDASGSAIGAILSQDSHPIAYFSKKLPPRYQASSAYSRVMYAITAAVRRWRQYLLGRRFTIVTDHRSLKQLLSQTIQTPEQQRWLTKLLGFEF